MAERTILFADNGRDFLDTRTEFLENEGYTVLKAHTLEQARQMLTNAHVHLAILDIHMPKVNGIAALQEIKQTTSSRVMMFTAYPYAQYRTKCCELGADSFLDKNTEFGRVNRVIERMQSESI